MIVIYAPSLSLSPPSFIFTLYLFISYVSPLLRHSLNHAEGATGGPRPPTSSDVFDKQHSAHILQTRNKTEQNPSAKDALVPSCLPPPLQRKDGGVKT